MPRHSRQAVVADIGGTHMRFAVADMDELRIDHYVQFRCADFPSFEAGFAAYLRSVPDHPHRAAVAVAGTVEAGIAAMSTRPWRIGVDDIRTLVRGDEVLLINDDAALALALPHLGVHDVSVLRSGDAVAAAAAVVVSSGSSLGVATLLSTPSGAQALAGDAGLVGFGASSGEELEIAALMRAGRRRLTQRDILSGAGLSALYSAFAELEGREVGYLPASGIVHAADTGSDPAAMRAVDTFIAWFGRFVGDVALIHRAARGVNLAGGIPPNILKYLKSGRFISEFSNRGGDAAWLDRVPVCIITAKDAGLRGAAASLA